MTVRRYVVRGSVQGVGYRYFVQQKARELLLTGTVRNLDNGSVEVVAAGTEEQLSQLSGFLHTGPPAAQVRGIEHHEAPMQQYSSFTITH